MAGPNFFKKWGLSFDDVLLLPNYSNFSRSEIDLSTKLTKKIKLALPLISSPMDTVTESKLAIALARLGGIGIIHRNLSVEAQVKEVSRVKREKVLVGATIGIKKEFENRVKNLVKAGTDVLVIDSAHGYVKPVIEAIRFIKRRYPKTEVIGGNVATHEGAKALIEAGVDGLRVGMGPGAICSTRIISGMGVPQITAVQETVREAKPKGIPVIADGGIRYSGDIVKALAVGASSVMVGSLFAAATEAPGKIINLSFDQVPARFKSILNNKRGKYQFKEYRGMGSKGAMKKGARVGAGEFHGKNYQERVLVAEGVEGLVPLRGKLKDIIEQLIGGVRSGMYYLGARNIPELWKKARFIQVTPASLKESHPHDIILTHPGENYF